MSDEKQIVRVQFAPLDPPKDEKGRDRKQSPVVEVANGDYYRKFDAAEQPFEVTGTSHAETVDGKERTVVDITPEEELRLLLADGHFVVVEESEPRAVATGSVPPASAGGSKKNLGKIGGAPASGQ